MWLKLTPLKLKPYLAAMRAQVYFHHCHTLSDARYAAAEGFEFIAFAIDPTLNDFPGMAKLKEIAGWVSGPRLVGQFPENTPLAVIKDAVEFLALEAVELTHPVNANMAEQLGLPIIVKVPWELPSAIASEYLQQNYLVILASTEAFDTLAALPKSSELQALCQQYDLILSCNFSTENLLHALEEWAPYGIALRGGEEERPGWYNYEQLYALTDILVG